MRKPILAPILLLAIDVVAKPQDNASAAALDKLRTLAGDWEARSNGVVRALAL